MAGATTGAVVALGLVSGLGATERLGRGSVPGAGLLLRWDGVTEAALVGGLPLRRRLMPTSTWLASCSPLMATKRLMGTP